MSDTLFDCQHGWIADLCAPAAVIGWRAQCSCGGWHGRTWLRADRATDHDPARRLLHCPDGHLDAAATDLVLAEWDRHRDEMQALIPVRLAYQDSLSAQRRLDEAVRFVRATGASWAAIGQVSGLGSAEDARRRFEGPDFGPHACDMR